MQIGLIGLGRMGANMARRLVRGDHECVVFDANSDAVRGLEQDGAIGVHSIEAFVARLQPPRAVWLMIPAALVDKVIAEVAPQLAPGDTLIDGGNSYFVDDIRRATELGSRGIHYVDVGTSGGIWGLERGYCLMIGGPDAAVRRLDPIFRTLAPGRGAIARTPNRDGIDSTAEEGYLHCGGAGAGHFVKMIHNGIEYGLMAAYAEGFNILKHANAGNRGRETDAETTPLRHPEHFQYDFNLRDIAELWRRGSVVSSWLLDLTAKAFAGDIDLSRFNGRVSDSGEGRWTVLAAVEQGTPAPVLTAALYQRFSSRGEGEFAAKILSAMRYEFGGHIERAASASSTGGVSTGEAAAGTIATGTASKDGT